MKKTIIACAGILSGFAAGAATLLPVIPQPVDRSDGDEAYELTIAADGSPVVKAKGRGKVWAMATYAQLKQAGANKPGLTIRDAPKYRVRALMLDVARKYFPLDFLRDLTLTMSHYKMNELHLHLNDNCGTNVGFRIECDTYKGLTSKDGSYTKKEFRAFVKWAATKGVNIVPEFDSPAHVGAFTRYDPSLASKKSNVYFDLSTDKPVEFMRKLFAEYLGGDDPVFAGPDFSVGTDEYEGGDPERFRRYTDLMFAEVRRYGKKPRAWGALTQMAGKTPVNPQDVTLDIWNNGYYKPADAIRDGFDVICVPDNLVYIVPHAGYYYDWLDCRRLFERWEPCDFDGWRTDATNPHLVGGKFALWNDLGEKGCDWDEAWARLYPAIQTLSQKMWSGKIADQPWSAFRALATAMPEPEGVYRLERSEKLYLEVDLASFKTRYLNAAPSLGWEDADFTERLLLRRVSTTNGVFYVGVNEISQAQYQRITGDNPSMDRGAEKPVDHVNFYEAERCAKALETKTGLVGFGLPCDEEWNGAWRERHHFLNLDAGAAEWTTELWKGDVEIGMLRDGTKEPRPSRRASRTASFHEGFRLVYRPAPTPDEFRLYGLEDVLEHKDGTEFAIRDAGERVAFSFKVRDATVCRVEKKVEFDLAYADRVEIYLSPNAEKTNGYVCVEIDSAGRPLDYHVTAKKQFLWDWNFKTLACSGRDIPGGFFVEGSVAKSELAEYGIDVRDCWIGVFRADCPAAHVGAVWYSAMPMAPRPHFHRVGMLFPLKLQPKRP